MTTHPRTPELARAVAEWIELIRPALDPRNAFLARVAANAMATIERELTQGPAADAEAVRRLTSLLGRTGDLEALEAALCAEIRAGRADEHTPGLLPALREVTLARLAIDQPSYRHEGLGQPGS